MDSFPTRRLRVEGTRSRSSHFLSRYQVSRSIDNQSDKLVKQFLSGPTIALVYILIVSLLIWTVEGNSETTTQKPENVQGVAERKDRSSDSSADRLNAAFVLRPEYFTVPVGGVIHLFPRYGYLSLSMKVISRNNTNLSSGSSSGPSLRNDSWMFLEPVNNVIDAASMRISETSFMPVNETQALPFHNMFHFDLCEDVRTLMEAYFKNFTIEGLDRPWQAFAGGWRTASIARNFGIDQAFVDGDYRYVLVKVMLVRGSGQVEPLVNATVADIYQPSFQRFKPDNDLSTYEFFKVVGTHYIHSYISGNCMYQVFVFDPDGFQAVKRRLFIDGIKNESVARSTGPIMEILTTWVKAIGRVVVLNAEQDVSEQVRNALTMSVSNLGLMPNLLKLHDNGELVREVETLLANQANGILGIDLRGIQFLFTDPVQREGFEKALTHKMQLWEINFLY